MLLVIDASVAVKCLVSEEDSVASEQLLGRGHVLHAPSSLSEKHGWRVVGGMMG